MQGIIPFKAEKMARKATVLMTTQLLSVKDVFARIDPAIVRASHPHLPARLSALEYPADPSLPFARSRCGPHRTRSVHTCVCARGCARPPRVVARCEYLFL